MHMRMPAWGSRHDIGHDPVIAPAEPSLVCMNTLTTVWPPLHEECVTEAGQGRAGVWGP